MVLLFIFAIWVGLLLLQLRLSQRKLVRTNWLVDLQLLSRIVLFVYYSVSVIGEYIRINLAYLSNFFIVVEVMSINNNQFKPATQLTFATSGLAVAVVFLIESENLLLLFTCFRRKHSHIYTDNITLDTSKLQQNFDLHEFAPRRASFSSQRRHLKDTSSLQSNTQSSEIMTPAISHNIAQSDKTKFLP